jgi:DNA-binding Lrp family transcriptional regulator
VLLSDDLEVVAVINAGSATGKTLCVLVEQFQGSLPLRNRCELREHLKVSPDALDKRLQKLQREGCITRVEGDIKVTGYGEELSFRIARAVREAERKKYDREFTPRTKLLAADFGRRPLRASVTGMRLTA